ncbi:MAG: hypothetical protein AAFZ91_06240 [Pseudomonadota bacterium]
MSLFKKIQRLVKKEPDLIPAPDLSRILRPDEMPKSAVSEPEAETSIDLDAWLARDLKAISEAWGDASMDNASGERVEAFRTAVHNFHGVSGAYGGGALTRLTGSLQRLIADDHDVQMQRALINLHIQACQAASLASADESDPIAMAVCESLEEQVEQILANRPA